MDLASIPQFEFEMPPPMRPTAAEAKAMLLVLGEIDPACTNFHLITENAYGTVYRVHHKVLNRTLALKIVRTVQDAEGNATNIYTSEIGGGPKDFSILQSLRHPHILEIVSIFRGGTFRSTSIFTEYMAGGTLLDRLQNEYDKQRGAGPVRGFSEIRCRDIFYQLCQAMSYIHSQRIVHRNLKLENIFLSEDNFPLVKVAGFGLATRLPDDGQGCLSELRGSLDYMSPEMLRQPPPGYDCRTDSWSAAVILIEMLLLENAYVVGRIFPETETPAFRWDDLRESARLSENGFDILHKLLNPDPNLRYTLADALRHQWLVYHRPMYPNIIYPQA
ncbi:kinase-like domain-containing protein [Favolaschia claudopus]|uniref:Kinase-like domain-containing protein n=1 Tax=Favolaschia claudopus TaxID=2862362 RepID=A0AAW0ABZ2_9AGAR